MVEELSATTENTDVPNNAAWSGNTELRALTNLLLSQYWHTFIICPHLPPLNTGKCLVPGVRLDSIYVLGTPNKGTLTDKKFPVIHNEDIILTLLMRKVTLNANESMSRCKKKDKC